MSGNMDSGKQSNSSNETKSKSNCQLQSQVGNMNNEELKTLRRRSNKLESSMDFKDESPTKKRMRLDDDDDDALTGIIKMIIEETTKIITMMKKAKAVKQKQNMKNRMQTAMRNLRKSNQQFKKTELLFETLSRPPLHSREQMVENLDVSLTSVNTMFDDRPTPCRSTPNTAIEQTMSQNHADANSSELHVLQEH